MLSAANPSFSGAAWEVQSFDAAQAELLQKELGLTPLVAQILAARGFQDLEETSKFLNPTLDDLHSPSLLPDYEAAVSEILKANESGGLIFIHGDYDVDGVTSAALLTRFLRKIGCQVHVHVPHRMKEGYGIHARAVEEARNMQCALFLTCDCGVAAHESIQQAKAAGMRVVVTDHHDIKETLPNADAIVNPHRSDSKYPFDQLAGVGVAFKLAAGIAGELGIPASNFYRAYLDLAAIGTIADVMPLVGENRIIVSHGLPLVSESKKVGIQALIRSAYPKLKAGDPLDTYHISFGLAPRLNAAGRIDDAALALELLMEADPDQAAERAEHLEKVNTQRRADQELMVEEAIAMLKESGQLEEFAYVVAGDWHPGIVGIVAGKITEQFSRPAFVATRMESGLKGSARSIRGFHLANALNQADELLQSHGGHELAAGFSLEHDNLEAFRLKMQSIAKELLTPDDLRKRTRIDAEVAAEGSTLESAQQFQKLRPFGNENPEPLLLSRNVKVAQVRPTSNPSVVQATFEHAQGRIGAVTFKLAESLLECKPGDMLDVVYRLGVDDFRAELKPKWFLEDARFADR